MSLGLGLNELLKVVLSAVKHFWNVDNTFIHTQRFSFLILIFL